MEFFVVVELTQLVEKNKKGEDSLPCGYKDTAYCSKSEYNKVIWGSQITIQTQAKINGYFPIERTRVWNHTDTKNTKLHSYSFTQNILYMCEDSMD